MFIFYYIYPFLDRTCVKISHVNERFVDFCLDLAANADKYRTDPDAKPPFSYATIICLAMRANNNKVSLSNIYAWIRENFLFYKYADPAWQVCINFPLPIIICNAPLQYF